jgi:hypothetical protein
MQVNKRQFYIYIMIILTITPHGSSFAHYSKTILYLNHYNNNYYTSEELICRLIKNNFIFKSL